MTHAPSSGLSRELRDTYVENAEGELDELNHSDRSAILARLTSLPVRAGRTDGEGREMPTLGQPPRTARKIGRNDPCPCGSGKKYKKCHGR